MTNKKDSIETIKKSGMKNIREEFNIKFDAGDFGVGLVDPDLIADFIEQACSSQEKGLIGEIREKIEKLEADEGVYEIVEIYNRKIGKITKREWKTNVYYNNAIRDVLSLLDSSVKEGVKKK